MDKPRAARKKSGRPPKFSEPRHSITVTLPETTLRSLQIVDSDRARAIVKVTKAAMDAGGNRKQVEVVEVGPGIGIILVGPSFYLQRIPGLRLMEVAPARFLLSFPSGTPVDSLEVALDDLTEEIPLSEVAERSIVENLRQLIRSLRQGRNVTKSEMLFVHTRNSAHGSS
jgi:hypothetical protein